MEGRTVGKLPAIRLGCVALIATVLMATSLVALSSSDAQGSTASENVWTAALSPTPAGSWYGVDYANGQWIVLGHGATVAVSSDGSTWTEYPVPSGSWQGVAYGDGRFVALSSVDASTEEMVSTNGTTWTPSSGPSGQWTGLTYGQGRFEAVSAQGQIVTSTNGVQWTTLWQHDKYDFTSVAYGNGRFVAVDGAVGATMLSFNGVDWRLYPSPKAGARWGAVSFGNGNFVAFDDSGNGDVATSVWGYEWTLHSYSPAQAIEGATFGCGSFVAVGETTGAANDFISSPTGASWTSAAVPLDAASDWTSVAYGAHHYVAVDSSGDIASAPSAADCSAALPTVPLQVSGNIHNGEIWTYMHPPSSAGGAPVNGYRVTITDGSVTKRCSAPVYFEPNCIIRGLKDNQEYWITAQSHNRFGYSVPTDPVFAIPVASWNFNAITTQRVVSPAAPVVVQVTGVVANSEGIYPTSSITVHVGSGLDYCHASAFGECLITVPTPSPGPVLIYATYTGYGRSYRSPAFRLLVTS
jgi:hypothetical protein